MKLMMLTNVVIMNNGHEFTLSKHKDYEVKQDIGEYLLMEGYAVPVKTYAPKMSEH